MLLSFRVANFRSFRDPQDFDLRQARLGQWGNKVSSVAAIYGPNAGGKSTFVDSIAYFQHVVRSSYARWGPNDRTGRPPFKLDDSSAREPTEFDIEFIAGDGFRYRYGFALDDAEIVAEWLYQYRTARPSKLFERDENTPNGIQITFGDNFRGSKDAIARTTRPNSLFLSAARAADNEVLRPVVSWIRDSLAVYTSQPFAFHSPDEAAIFFMEDSENANQILDFIRASDLGIVDGEVELEEFPEAQRRSLISIMRAVHAADDEIDEDSIPRVRPQIKLKHRANGASVALSFNEESQGTQVLFGMSPRFIEAIRSGGVCVFDELDTSLHPMVVADIVRIFNSPKTNPLQAQLIFTTHDISLLGSAGVESAVLDREQVWVVEKDRSGASELIALSEYKPRKEENLLRGYVTGRYGGIPTPSLGDAFSQGGRNGAV